MYKILLVDDEPLVLIGIKSILDWRMEQCEYIGNAGNGCQAIEAIEQMQPDIVIADINMPQMNGVELLRRANEAYPEIVFIMLTNLQEFELALESLRYRAVDYLVKTELDTDALRDSLMKAKAESDFRRDKMESRRYYKLNNEVQALTDGLELLLTSPELPAEMSQLLLNAGVMESYCLATVQFLPLSSADIQETNIADADDTEELTLWEYELADELIKKCFPRAVSVALKNQRRKFAVLIWGGEASSYEGCIQDFYKKLLTVSSDIMGCTPCLLSTDTMSGSDSLRQCRKQMLELWDYFYITGQQFITYQKLQKMQKMSVIEYKPLGLNGIAGNLKKEVIRKNAAGCATLFERAILRVKQVPHERSQAIWLCTEVYFTICDNLNLQHKGNDIFTDSAIGYEKIKGLATREDVVHFLTVIGNELSTLLRPALSRNRKLIEKVKGYVYENFDKRISLQEVANHVYLSPGYLSSIYKKECGENLMDFINRCKIEKACELLAQEEYLISQVGNMLSFDNAHYFAKIFKKYMGITPSEYRKHMNESLER